MRRGRPLAEGPRLLLLGLWLGAFAGYRAPHYRIADGHIVQRLFATCDTLQLLSAVIAGLTLA